MLPKHTLTGCLIIDIAQLLLMTELSNGARTSAGTVLTLNMNGSVLPLKTWYHHSKWQRSIGIFGHFKCLHWSSKILQHFQDLVTDETGLILGLRPANERHRFKVTRSLIGWAQTENQPCEHWPPTQSPLHLSCCKITNHSQMIKHNF